MNRLSLIISFTFLLISGLSAQADSLKDNIIQLNSSSLNQGIVIGNTNKIWKYKSGDSLTWSRPQYPDINWTKTPITNLNSIVWYRLYLVGDSTLLNRTIAINGNNSGKIQIYYDGQLICSSLSRIPQSLPQIQPGKHLLAIRYQFPIKNSNSGFFIQLSLFKNNMNTLFEQKSEQMIFTTLPLTFALLHLILFLFLPEGRANLYYTLFLILFAIATYADIQSSYLAEYSQSHYYLMLHRFFIPLVEITFLLFLYEIFYDKLPKQFWAFVAAYLIVQVLILIKPVANYHYFVELSIIRTLEIIRVITVAIHRKKDGAVIFAIGIFILFIFGLYDALLDLDLMAPVNGVTNAYYFGIIGLFVVTSVFLSRDFARNNQKIINQQNEAEKLELERKILIAEDKRKSGELEDARRFQLSMLPQCLNDFPNLDVCLSQHPAAEVGGDYYDYYIDKNNVLTVVVGDATGHGMRAGMMVSIIKSLFVADIKDCHLVPFLNKATNTIKQMNLGKIYMALQLLRINKSEITISSAGMPPVFIYRKETDTVQEITLKAMPLGGPVSLPYTEFKTTVKPGDTILMLSDGLPELFNSKKEIMDYPRVKSKFKEAVHKTADEIVCDLFQLGKKWRNDYPQEDDMTAVVIKIKN